MRAGFTNRLRASLLTNPTRRSASSTAQTFVKRTTLLKVPSEDDIEVILRDYAKLRKASVKDGKPYIVSNAARRVLNTESPLSEGFTLSLQSIFKNEEDHAFYVVDCPAHDELRQKVLCSVGEGITTVVTQGEWSEPNL